MNFHNLKGIHIKNKSDKESVIALTVYEAQKHCPRYSKVFITVEIRDLYYSKNGMCGLLKKLKSVQVVNKPEDFRVSETYNIIRGEKGIVKIKT